MQHTIVTEARVHIAEPEGFLEQVVFEGIAGGPGPGRDA